jgi:hypothetical protein
MDIHRKIDVAKAQLEQSICLFFDGDYYSAATLAGASEEILGKALESTSKRNELQHQIHVRREVGKLFGVESPEKQVRTNLNEVRNWLKHFTNGEDLEFDSRDAAAELIERANSNYMKLTGDEAEGMPNFLRFQIDPNNAHVRIDDSDV